MRRNLARFPPPPSAPPRAPPAAHAAAHLGRVARDLNHRRHASLGGGCACELFHPNRRHAIVTYGQRKEVAQELMQNVAVRLAEIAPPTRRQAQKAWRRAVEDWLLNNGYGVEKIKAVSPSSSPPKGSLSGYAHNLMKTVQQMWKNKAWPVRNGLYFADGNVALLEVSMPWETTNNTVFTTVFGSSTLQKIDEFRENNTTHLAPLCQESYTNLNLRIIGGEGSHGSEGFIAVTQMTTDNLVWLAYFDCSNPFEKVSLANGVVTAVSNLGHSWRIPLMQPKSMTVDTGK